MKSQAAKKSVRRRRVTFTFESVADEAVILMGDFNQWNQKTHPMKNDGEGLWKKTVMLFPGRYEYRFLVDEEWQNDLNKPLCPNSFGTYNNVIEIS